MYFQEVELYGLEAASRGAKKAILCDKSRDAIEIIRKNINKTHLEENVEVYHKSFEEFLSNCVKDKADLIYIDPPYQTDFVYNALELIIQKELFKEDTIIIIETDQEEKILEKIKTLEIEIIDQRKYGRACLIFLNVKK